jgi:hypothetical protein
VWSIFKEIADNFMLFEGDSTACVQLMLCKLTPVVNGLQLAFNSIQDGLEDR